MAEILPVVSALHTATLILQIPQFALALSLFLSGNKDDRIETL